MYYKLGRYEPSDKFIIAYRNKEILKQYKIISEEWLDMKHALYKIYGYLHNINERTKPVNKLNKNNEKNKNNINNTKQTTTILSYHHWQNENRPTYIPD